MDAPRLTPIQQEALARQYVRLRPQAIRMATRLIGDRELAEDLYQAAWVSIIRREATRWDEPLGDGGVIESLRRLALRHQRDQRRHKALLARHVAAPGHSSPCRNLFRELAVKRTIAAASELIGSWSDLRRDVFRLCWEEGLSSRAAAEQLGRSCRAVEKQREKIRRDLQGLRPEMVEGPPRGGGREAALGINRCKDEPLPPQRCRRHGVPVLPLLPECKDHEALE